MEGKGGEQRAINLARGEASDRETIVQHFHVFSFCTLLTDKTLATTVMKIPRESFTLIQEEAWTRFDGNLAAG